MNDNDKKLKNKVELICFGGFILFLIIFCVVAYITKGSRDVSSSGEKVGQEVIKDGIKEVYQGDNTTIIERNYAEEDLAEGITYDDTESSADSSNNTDASNSENTGSSETVETQVSDEEKQEAEEALAEKEYIESYTDELKLMRSLIDTSEFNGIFNPEYNIVEVVSPLENNKYSYNRVVTGTDTESSGKYSNLSITEQYDAITNKLINLTMSYNVNNDYTNLAKSLSSLCETFQNVLGEDFADLYTGNFEGQTTIDGLTYTTKVNTELLSDTMTVTVEINAVDGTALKLSHDDIANSIKLNDFTVNADSDVETNGDFKNSLSSILNDSLAELKITSIAKSGDGIYEKNTMTMSNEDASTSLSLTKMIKSDNIVRAITILNSKISIDDVEKAAKLTNLALGKDIDTTKFNRADSINEYSDKDVEIQISDGMIQIYDMEAYKYISRKTSTNENKHSKYESTDDEPLYGDGNLQ